MSTSVETLSDYEIERGKPMPSTVHAFIQGNLIFFLKSGYRDTYHILPELSLDIPGMDVPGKPAVPDIAIYPKFEIDVLHDTIKRSDAPLATVEILSPTQSLDELVEKTYRYFQMGVQSCWIILPSMKAVAVYHKPGSYTFFTETDTLQDDHLNIRLPLEGIFKG